MESRPRVVILGAGFGGLLTALQLSRRDKHLDIVLVDKNDIHVYKPWLYDVATSMLVDPERHQVRDLARSAALSVPAILQANKAKNVRFRQDEVADVHTLSKHVTFKNGQTLRYDKLVVAVGSDVNFFNIGGMQEHALPLSTLQDAMQIRSRIESTLRDLHRGVINHCSIVVIGAGPTGTEAAAELANFLKDCDRVGLEECANCRIVLIDAGPAVLGPFSPFTQKHASRRLERFGVDVHTNTIVTKVEDGHVFAKGNEAEGEKNIPYDVLVWAGGVRSNKLLANLEAQKTERGRLQVDEFLRVRGVDDVFAVGDCAAFVDHKKRELPPTAWAAMLEGPAAAKNVLSAIQSRSMKPLESYRSWPAIITLGGRQAVAELFGIHWVGRFVFFVRRLVDLRYFLKILPVFQALAVWKRGVLMLAKND